MAPIIAPACRWVICASVFAVSSAICLTPAAPAQEPIPRALHSSADENAAATSPTDELASPQQRRGRGRGRGFGMQGLYKARIEPNWFADNSRFWYRNNLRGDKKEFVVVDVEKGARKPAFDREKLAASLSDAAKKTYQADQLPFNRIEFTEDQESLRFVVDDTQWECNFETYDCKKLGDAPEDDEEDQSDERRSRFGRRRFGRGEGRGQRSGRGGPSPDGKWESFVRDGNVFIRAVKNDDNQDDDQQDDADNENAGEEFQLTKDGTQRVRYGLLEWAPDSKTLVAFRIEPGDRKEVYLVETSPRGGGRARMTARPYDLPGDKLTSYELNLFDVAEKKRTKPKVDKIDLGFPRLRWDNDGRHFAYEKADRGHQRFRVIRVDSHTGDTRDIIDEKTDTFIWTAHAENVDLDMVNWLPDTDEIIYVSERDGWRHMYLVDAEKGEIKNQITKGEFVVRGIDRIDEDKRRIWFTASGKNPDQDPYFLHYYRVDFDGTDLTALTEGDGNHSALFSPDRKYVIDTYSRVDMPPKHNLRRTSDGKLVCSLEEADATELMERDDYHPLEVFVAKGRDGKTDIWGVICRPRDFDPDKKYPVIESIYAGPQGSFVPKSFGGGNRYATLADLGFIVVQIDGMGTANRSKAFHDVCWHNIKDAGFPDRILWMKAAAEKYPYMDLSRVGIYGGSAGGQNAAAGVLFHPEFYKAAVAGCGCHDNRMDKASWNEQWMGYPVGPQYSECSNIDNAARLEGKLMLIVGELDNNVPVESTYRFADALIKADKDFDLIVVPGAGHGMGGEYGMRRLQDFFVRHLQGTDPPDRNLPGSGQIARNRAQRNRDDERDAPLDLASLSPAGNIRKIVDRFRADRANLRRYYTVERSPAAIERWKGFYTDWLVALRALPSANSNGSGRRELNELKHEVAESLSRLEYESRRQSQIKRLIPFAPTIIQLAEDRRQVKKVDAEKAAAIVDQLSRQIRDAGDEVRSGLKPAGSDEAELSAENLTYAAETVGQLRDSLRSWYRFYDGYDPQFTWWLRAPYQQADEALEEYSEILGGEHEEASAGASPPSPNTSGGNAKTDSKRDQSDGDAPNLSELIDAPRSHMEPIILAFQAEFPGQRGMWGNRDRYRDANRSDDDDDEQAFDGRERGGSQAGRRRPDSPAERQYAQARYQKWLTALDELDFDKFSQADRVDYLLLKNHIHYLLQKPATRDRSDDRRDLPASADRPIRGRAIGRDALLVELAHEMIPYSPEQLLVIAERENDWCERELIKAAREMDLGDDWQKAVERVKRMHVPPGQQPYLIRDLAVEAIDYLKEHDLVTVPPLAAETWGLQMMSPRRQLVNPFFTGGNEISVSFPTDTMSHEEKLQSMRGNNIPFARATVHHELIPGHNLQFYMTARHHPYRRMFSTPFWGEGWALYWEMLLYDRGFPKTPEDRVGFLTWRKHRCARIIFSLSFHLGRMTPDQCIDFLVKNVGFDRHNAAAEVRRSFEGAEPLYQAAYMLGGLQIRELRKELVDSGRLSDREFHDAILHENSMPIVLVRALLTDEKLTKDFVPKWEFYGPISDDKQVAGAAP